MQLVPDVLNLGSCRSPESRCLFEGERSLTYAELDARADRVAQLLSNHGVQPGDRIALLAKNELEFVELQIGAQRCGAIFVPLNYRLSDQELKLIIKDCTPKLVFAGPDHEEQSARLGAPVISLRSQSGSDYLAQMNEEHPAPLCARMHPSEAIAQILYTSGTTGHPKGVVVTNGAFYSRMLTLAVELNTKPAETHLQTMPLFHLAGTLTFSCLMVGAACVVVRIVDAGKIWRQIGEHKVTCLYAAPTILEMILQAEQDARDYSSSLHTVCYGASVMPEPLLKRARTLIPAGFACLYGLTEAGVATLLRPEDHDVVRHPDRVGTLGFDMLGYETTIMSAAGTQLGLDEVGEICIRGPGVMKCYWGNEEAAESTFEEGWLRTGDGGKRNADGVLVLADRIKDMVITGGENVYSTEVERVLLESPSIAECAVIGYPDDLLGERVHAVIVLSGDVRANLEDIDRHCRERLAGYKRPRSWSVVDDLPRNSMGKIVKQKLRNKLTSLPHEILERN